MRRLLPSLWWAAAGLWLAAVLFTSANAQSGWPNLPPSTVMGRLAIGTGPAQAIPFATLTQYFYGAQSANVVFAGPTSGGTALPTWRALVGADLPVPSASTLGGIESIVALTHNWIAYIDTSGVPHQGQPAFTDISGTLALGSQVAGTLAGSNMSATNPGTTGNGGLAYAAASVNVLRNSSLSAWFHGCVSGACTHTTTAATTNYSAEGIFVIPTGASVTSQATATVPAGNPGYYADKITGASSNTDIKVRWVVESYSAAKIAGLVTTFQFTFINNSGSTITPVLTTKYPTTQDGSVTGGAAWGGSTSDLSSTNLTACTNGSTCLEAYTFTPSSSATAGYEFVVDFGAMNSNSDSITIGAGFDARATPGVTSPGIPASPPAPEVSRPSDDILWCERFYDASYDNGVAPGAASSLGMVGGSYDRNASTGTTQNAAVYFKAPMRSVPTIAYWDGAGNASKVTSSASNNAFVNNEAATTAPFNISTRAFLFMGYNGTADSISFIHYTADASLWGG
jgi:hypothetical protein